MGIPENWSTVENWLNPEILPQHPGQEKMETYCRKNESIPILDSYSLPPNEKFWDSFPKRELPTTPETKVNVGNLENLIIDNVSKLSKSEIKRAARLIYDLRYGADACQKSELPPMATNNSPSAINNGALLTDKIATWTMEKIVAGPFPCPPMAGFRSNPLIAIMRNDKIRPVINMSGPKGQSFNDNLDKFKIEKVRMTTAKAFGSSLKEMGRGAKFSKFDIKDAYKLVPAKIGDLRLQGFTWLNKYFCETQQTFGAVPSVCNFDRLGNTIVALVAGIGNIPRKNISRTLDDFQCIGPADSDVAENFVKTMRMVCEHANIPLADICPKKEKSFVLETRGSVLGTGFDSIKMEWFWTKEKADRLIRRCLNVISSSHISLKQTQEVMGSVNDFCQLNKFLKFFKSKGNSLLSAFNLNENILLPVPEELKKDLLIICKSAESAVTGLPIPDRKALPPMSTLVFYTDAAGAKYTTVGKQFRIIDEPNRGVACVGGESMENIWMWSRFSWPKDFLSRKDEKGVEFGRKSTTLESIGLLIPFMCKPKTVAGKHLLFYVDNIAVHYGWENGGLKKDSTATKILQAVHVLASYLGTTVHVYHVPRVSNKMADLADDLTRRWIPENEQYREAMIGAEFVPCENDFLDVNTLTGKVPLYDTLLKEMKYKTM
jgi:hypothetical protein